MMDDLIRREAAIDALREAENHAFNSYYQGLKKAHKIIANLPSDRKEPTGHWIIMGDRYIKCSKCGHITKTESPDIYNFCMVCGSRMSENPTYPESEG